MSPAKHTRHKSSDGGSLRLPKAHQLKLRVLWPKLANHDRSSAPLRIPVSMACLEARSVSAPLRWARVSIFSLPAKVRSRIRFSPRMSLRARPDQTFAPKARVDIVGHSSLTLPAQPLKLGKVLAAVQLGSRFCASPRFSWELCALQKSSDALDGF
jgi:hypothetical protein